MKIITNSLGQKLFRIFCPQCDAEHNYSQSQNYLKHQKKFHSTANGYTPIKKVKKIKKAIVPKITPSIQTKPDKELFDRVFYVDAALSVKNKEGKRYWKCSVVEDGKNVANWVNSVCNQTTISKKNGKRYQIGTNTAEAYTVLKVVFWLMERKWQGSIKIYTDNNVVSNYCQQNKNKTKIQSQGFKKYLSLACSYALANKIDLNVDWVKGIENPADYYSRH